VAVVASFLLGAVFGLAAMVSLSLWCIPGRELARRLTAEWQWRVLNMLLAFLLVASIIPMWLP
jgi:hypothetical protein